MKKISFVILFCLVGSSFAQQGWFLLTPINLASNTHHLTFPSQDTGFLSGGDILDSPFIKKTFDGGKIWTDVIAPLINYPHCGFFFDSRMGYYLDADSAIIRTTDGGLFWDRFSIGDPFGLELSGMSFGNPSIGFVCGREKSTDYGILLKSIDSGKTWSPILFDSLQNTFIEVDFRNPLDGYLLVQHHPPYLGSNMLFTSDGGVHWIRVDTNGGTFLYYAKGLKIWIASIGAGVNRWSEDGSISQRIQIFDPGQQLTEEISSMNFYNDLIGYISTTKGRIFKTTNSGLSWFLQITPKDYTGYGNIVAPSAQVAYAVDYNVIIKTIDGGDPPVNTVKNTQQEVFSLKIIANPISFSADFQFAALKQGEVFELFDLVGRSLLRQQLPAGQASLHLDMQKYPAGIFFARLGSETVRFAKY